MKIATWNVERLKHRKSLDEIIAACERSQANILILTENDEAIKPKYRNCCHTPTPPPLKLQGYDTPITYTTSEHRVSIYTNYTIVCQHPTFDEYTALCIELETEKGNILVYGTIMGIIGNRHPSFEADLIRQTEDFRRLTAAGHRLCICGDYNCSFSDNYYFTKSGRQRITDTFSECGIELITAERPTCIDHIAVSKQLINDSSVQFSEWNTDKALSDHKGISIQFD